MADFKKVLAESTAKGANGVPGCVLAAVDKTGKTIYSEASGYNGCAPDATEIDIHGTFWIASCTKLVGTIAALQCVERGQCHLDAPVTKILPELANPDIVNPSVDEEEEGGATGDNNNNIERLPFTLRKANNKITLRHLLCHASGLGYDLMDPTIMAWRASRGEASQWLSGTVVKANSVPLRFEPGEGYLYGGNIDWAGEMVARLNNMTLEEYLKEHVYEPLGLTSTTFRLEKHDDIKARLVKTVARTEDGGLKEDRCHWPEYAPEDCAGGGLYSSVDDFIKIIGDLIKDEPTLLKKVTVNEMFSPQFGPDSPSQKSLQQSGVAGVMTGATGATEGFNWGIGGLLIQEDLGSVKKGTLCWGGYPNVVWFANRERGVAGMYASQVAPPVDQKSADLARQFLLEVWRLSSS